LIKNKRWSSNKEAMIHTTFCNETLREARDLNQLPYLGKDKKIICEKEDLDAYL